MSKTSQSQILLPLLEAIDEAGGCLKPREAYEAVSAKLEISPEARSAKTKRIRTRDADREFNAFERDVRWARQLAVLRGYIDPGQRGAWTLTDAGKKGLRDQVRGRIVPVFETECGVAIWASAEDAVGFIEKDSVDLIFTSPPYPLLKQKEYGNLAVAEWLDWMTCLAEGWAGMLAPTGSLMLNLGPTYESGQPTQSPYIERLTLRLIDDLGLHLCDRLFWHNPAKMPAPAEWVTVRRVRVKPSIEPILWFAKTPHPKADNRNVLVPYSESMQRYVARAEKQVRPSGHALSAGGFKMDAGGAIPPTLLTAANTSSNDPYRRACREAGLPLHPATFPKILPEFCMKLTTDVGDQVYDPFFGSGTTGDVAERLGRRWIGTERSLAYLAGAAKRFKPAAAHVEMP
jgi:site-specific DNA-methyltransferase (cytosine-N4-specific)